MDTFSEVGWVGDVGSFKIVLPPSKIFIGLPCLYTKKKKIDSDIEFFHHIYPKIWTSQFNSNTELFTTFNANIWLRHRNFLLLNKSIWLRHRILFTISIAPDEALFLTKCCWYFSYFSTKTYIVGTHQKCLPRHKKYMLWLPFKSILPRHVLWIP